MKKVSIQPSIIQEPEALVSTIGTQTLKFDKETQTQQPVMMDEETQTPKPPKITLCDKAVQTEDNDFFSGSSFLSDDSKVQYYTGLSSYLLLKTFELVTSPIVHGEKRLYYWKYFLVLLKLKLNLGFQDTTYRMGISKATVSRKFYEMLCTLAWNG